MLKLNGISINAKPRKDGRFQGYIIDKDKNFKKYVYGQTREEVETKIKFMMKNGIPKPKRKDSRVINGIPQCFDDFAMYYFENFRKHKVSEQTYRTDLNRYVKYLKSYFENKPIKLITPLDCQILINGIVAEGKGKTADEIFSLLSVIMNMAIRHGIIIHNPVDIILHIPHERRHGKSLTREEETAFKQALAGSQDELGFMVLLYTGLRPNELKTAKIEGNFIVAVNSKRKTKSVEYKKIPITPMLKKYIGKSEFKFPSERHYREAIKKYLPKHILYDLRTTFYSRCKECGISDNAIKEYMGHSLGALGNAYTDLSDDYLLKEGEKLNY